MKILKYKLATETNHGTPEKLKKARTNMVNTLINDAEKYGFDGINLDCENIKSAYAKDY